MDKQVLADCIKEENGSFATPLRIMNLDRFYIRPQMAGRNRRQS